MATPERASLLGLPRELRDQIYGHVLMTKLKITFSKSGGMFERATFTLSEPGRFSLPWVNLSLACKTCHHDLQDYVEDNKKRRSGPADDLRTYVMDITFNQGDLEVITWRHLPCTPAQAKIIIVNAKAPEQTSFGGDGGPGQPAYSLWYLLNNTLHYGPRMQHPALPEHMHVQELRMQLHQRNGNSHGRQTRAFEYIYSWMHTLLWPGFLFGYVDRLYVSIKQHTKELVVQSRGDCSVPHEWVRWGFKWGAAR